MLDVVECRFPMTRVSITTPIPYQAFESDLWWAEAIGTVACPPSFFNGPGRWALRKQMDSLFISGDVPSMYVFNSLVPAITAAAGNLRVNQLYVRFKNAVVGDGPPIQPRVAKRQPRFPQSDRVAAPNIYAVAKVS